MDRTTIRTYPHDIIKIRCSEKYTDRWSIYECIVNSLLLYYGKISREELKKRKEKFVEV